MYLKVQTSIKNPKQNKQNTKTPPHPHNNNHNKTSIQKKQLPLTCCNSQLYFMVAVFDDNTRRGVLHLSVQWINNSFFSRKSVSPADVRRHNCVALTFPQLYFISLLRHLWAAMFLFYQRSLFRVLGGIFIALLSV